MHHDLPIQAVPRAELIRPVSRRTLPPFTTPARARSYFDELVAELEAEMDGRCEECGQREGEPCTGYPHQVRRIGRPSPKERWYHCGVCGDRYFELPACRRNRGKARCFGCRERR